MALIKRHEDLNAWQRAYEVALEINRLTNESSFDKKWAIKDQMLRSSLSISSNIAEGFGRKSKKDFARFLLIAMGSNDELRNQLRFSFDTKLITEEDFNSLNDKLIEVRKMTHGLRKYLLNGKQWAVNSDQYSVLSEQYSVWNRLKKWTYINWTR